MQRKQQKTIIVAGILVSIAIGLALIFYAGQRLSDRLLGPTDVALAADNSLWVISHQHLHQLRADGARLQKIPLAVLGFDDVVSGIGAAGNDTVFITKAEPSSIYRCTFPDKRCVDITPAVVETAGRTSYAVMLAADDATRRLVISDNRGHRVLIADFDGNVLAQSSPHRFRFPNQPRWLASDEIAVPDTNHNRIVRISVNDGQLGDDLEELSTDEIADGRPGRIWPMDVLREPKGQWWVLNARNGMKDADLIRFDADGKPLLRVDLGADSDPTAVALLGESVIVADRSLVSLSRIFPVSDGFRSEPFGDATFQNELQQIISDQAFWSRARIGGQVVCVLGPLLGILLLWRLGESLSIGRLPIKRPENSPLEVNGIHWISADPKFTKRGRWVFIAHLMLTVAAMAVLFWLVAAKVMPDRSLEKIGWVMGICLIPIALFDVYMLVRGPLSWRARLGTDGETFLLDPDRGLAYVESHPFEMLATNGRSLLVGRHLIQLHTPLGVLFDRDELAGYILARMPKSCYVSGIEFVRRSLQNGNRVTWSVVVLFSLLIVLNMLAVFSPGLVASWKAMFFRAAALFLG